MKSLKPNPSSPDATFAPSDLHGSSPLFVPGKKLTILLEGFGTIVTITPVLLVNNEREFKWRGGNLWVGFQGDHGFRWEEAEENGVRGTRMVHEEMFSGFLSSLLMGNNWLAGFIGIRDQSQKNFQQWTEDFKKRCENEPKKVV